MTSAYMPPSVQTLGEGREYSVRESKESLANSLRRLSCRKVNHFRGNRFLVFTQKLSKHLVNTIIGPIFLLGPETLLDRKIDLEIITCKLAAAKEFHKIKPALLKNIKFRNWLIAGGFGNVVWARIPFQAYERDRIWYFLA